MSPTNNTFAIFVIFCCAISFAFASDPDTLQDLCVALPSSGNVYTLLFTILIYLYSLIVQINVTKLVQ